MSQPIGYLNSLVRELESFEKDVADGKTNGKYFITFITTSNVLVKTDCKRITESDSTIVLVESISNGKQLCVTLEYNND